MKKLKNILSAIIISGVACAPAFAEVETYSGVYKDHQLIPNIMATLCKISAEDVVKDPLKLRECVNKLALKRRNSDAETAREGLKELHDIKLDQLQEMLALATAKGVASADYYAETGKEIAEANANAKTVNDVDGAAVNTSAALTAIVNSMRDLYVEQLKYLAIANIENIEKDVLEDVASLETLNQAKEEAAPKEETNAKPAGTEATNTVSTLTEETPKTKLQFVDGVCKLCAKKGAEWECREQICPDGEYVDANNEGYTCKNGVCEKINSKTPDEQASAKEKPEGASQ